MKCLVTSFCTIVIFLTACGGYGTPLGLDGNKIHHNLVEEAVKRDIIGDGIFKKRQIIIEKVCAAISKDQKEFGHQSDYIVDWKTSDAPTADYGGYYRYIMNEEEYSFISDPTQHEIFDEINCHVF